MRCIPGLDAQAAKLDSQYDALNEAMAQGQVHGFYTKEFLGKSLFKFAVRRFHTQAEAAMKAATFACRP